MSRVILAGDTMQIRASREHTGRAHVLKRGQKLVQQSQTWSEHGWYRIFCCMRLWIWAAAAVHVQPCLDSTPLGEASRG